MESLSVPLGLCLVSNMQKVRAKTISPSPKKSKSEPRRTWVIDPRSSIVEFHDAASKERSQMRRGAFRGIFIFANR